MAEEEVVAVAAGEAGGGDGGAAASSGAVAEPATATAATTATTTAAYISSDDNNDHDSEDDDDHEEIEEPHHHHHHHHKRPHHHHHHHHHNHGGKNNNENGSKVVPSKDSLWHNALEVKLSDTDLLQITGLTSAEKTVFARVVYVDEKEGNGEGGGGSKNKDEKEEEKEQPEGGEKKEKEEEAVSTTTTTTKTGDCKFTATIYDVVDRVVTESWRHLAKEIMEKKKMNNDKAGNDEKEKVVATSNKSTSTTGSTVDTYPSTDKLFEIGAVWLLDETKYVHGGDAHAHRVLKEATTPAAAGTDDDTTTNNKDDPKDADYYAAADNKQDANHGKKKKNKDKKNEKNDPTKDDPTLQVPDWNDMTLRIYLSPERFFVSYEHDWSKYCRGRMFGEISVRINDGNKPHPVPVNGLPDIKDGVIVYEDTNHHFLVINKPGCVPVHPTRANHAEDVVSMMSNALQERHDLQHKDKEQHHEQEKKLHAIVPQRLSESLDIATHGLLAVASDPSFANYYNHLFDNKKKKKTKKKKNSNSKSDHDDDANDAQQEKKLIRRSYKCLVGVPDSDTINRLEHMQSHQTTIVHYTDPRSPTPKRFVRRNPDDKHHHHKHHHHPHHNDHHQWKECQLRIKKIGDKNFRAACVRSVYPDSVDSSLAHRLWGPESKAPAEDLGFQYVMELEVEILNKFHRRDQIRGQLAALGCPIVGDEVYGGGICELYSKHHVWNRMAIQCNELSFPEPMWEDETHDDGACDGNKPNNNNNKKKQKKKLVASSGHTCVFRLERAWWSEYIDQYELYHTSY